MPLYPDKGDMNPRPVSIGYRWKYAYEADSPSTWRYIFNGVHLKKAEELPHTPKEGRIFDNQELFILL